jgi:hypothetical protein
MICKYLWLTSKTLKLGKLKSFKDFALVHSTNTYTPCFLLLFFIYYFFLYLSAIKGSPILTRKLFSKKNQAQRQPTFKPTHFSSRQGHEKTQSNHQIFTTSIHMLEIFIHLHSTILLLFTKSLRGQINLGMTNSYMYEIMAHSSSILLPHQNSRSFFNLSIYSPDFQIPGSLTYIMIQGR